MDTILVLLHTEPDALLSTSACEAVGAASRLGGELGVQGFSLGIIGASTQQALDGVASCETTRFLTAEHAELTQSRYATNTTAAEAVCRASGATLIVAPMTSR